MAEVVKIKISPAVAAYVRPGTSPDIRLAGCQVASTMPPEERVVLLFCLSRDAEISIRQAADACLGLLPYDVVEAYLAASAPYPAVLGALARTCYRRSDVARLLLSAVALPDDVRGQLQGYADLPVEASSEVCAEPEATEDESDLELTGDVAEGAELGSVGEEAGDEDVPADEDEPMDGEVVDEEIPEEEEYLSKYKMAQVMGIGEKIKMALSGDKEWRSILIKDSNKLVSGSVVKNPRMTEAEVLSLVKTGVQNDEIMRIICANKEWLKNYQIRKALVENNRTPVQASMRFLATLGEKDIAHLAKSKNISSVLSTQAKRLLLNKKK